MQIITISGLDGSGKSTQIEMLKNELERQGSKVFYFHAIEFSLAKKMVDFRSKYCLICRLSGKCKTSSNQEKSVTSATLFQIFLRKVFLRIDIWRFDLLRSKLRNNGYDYILSDRYFYDSVVNVEYLEFRICRGLINQTSTVPVAAKPLQILKPDVAIYLQTFPETIMQRERVPDQGLEYLEKKKELYDAKTAVWNWEVIDGNRSKEEIFEKIKSLLTV